jgi:hypothetical protein
VAGIAAGFLVPDSFDAQIKHVILILPGGARKKDYYENASLAPSIGELAADGFVFEEDHCETVTSHRACVGELVRGLLDRFFVSDESRMSAVLREFSPSVLVLRQMAQDKGHEDYENYLDAIRGMDRSVRKIADFVRHDPLFKEKTAIVIRPEFGRDDIVNQFGQLHHSPGFYCTHRVASIFWGPGIKRGVERKIVDRRNFGLRVESMLSRGFHGLRGFESA